MAVCDVQALISENPCLHALNEYTLEVLNTQQLCALYNNLDSGEPLECDIQTLLSDAECLYGRSVHELKVIQAQLLCNIFAIL
jgi:hypothetical protein